MRVLLFKQPNGVTGKQPFPSHPGEMIQQDIYKIPITKMNLESGAVGMVHPSQIIKNQVLPACSSKFVLSGGFSKSSACLIGSVVNLVWRGILIPALNPFQTELNPP